MILIYRSCSRISSNGIVGKNSLVSCGRHLVNIDIAPKESVARGTKTDLSVAQETGVLDWLQS